MPLRYPQASSGASRMTERLAMATEMSAKGVI